MVEFNLLQIGAYDLVLTCSLNNADSIQCSMMNANHQDSNLYSETWVQSVQRCASLFRCHDPSQYSSKYHLVYDPNSITKLPAPIFADVKNAQNNSDLSNVIWVKADKTKKIRSSACKFVLNFLGHSFRCSEFTKLTATQWLFVSAYCKRL
jgi:hypothetical protein